MRFQSLRGFGGGVMLQLEFWATLRESVVSIPGGFGGGVMLPNYENPAVLGFVSIPERVWGVCDA